MRNFAPDASDSCVSKSAPTGFAIWKRRLLTLVTILTLWGASILALDMAGPNAQALLAGEGMLINPGE